VTHRTFRSLDDPPKLLGFSLRQWAALIAGASVVLSVVYVTHLPMKAAITLCVFTIGLPTALTYVSESGGLQLGVVLRDAWRWRVSAHTLPAASPLSGPPPGLLVAAASEIASNPTSHAQAPGVQDPDYLERWE
jgi:hypothetical protein